MNAISKDTIGILPAGALGVAMAFHLSDGFAKSEKLCFLSRSESKSRPSIPSDHSLLLDCQGQTRPARQTPPLLPPLPELGDRMPGIILAGPMPDQLFSVLRDLVAWLGSVATTEGLEAAVSGAPALIMTSNGIYFQRLRRYYLELLEEAVMLGSLPDLWPDAMPRLVGRLLRGVTVQTGLRTGSGAHAVYRPGPPARTTLAGGDKSVRESVRQILSQRGMIVAVSDFLNPTRLEFEKAIVNLAGNLFGQVLAVAEDGTFQRLTIAQTHKLLPPGELESLVETLVNIGKAVRAYPPEYQASESLAFLRHTVSEHGEHVASSVQLLESRIRNGSLDKELPPTEAWLLEPLLNFARAKELPEEESYLSRLKQQLSAALARASSRLDR